MESPTLNFLAGTTASGKSDLAMAWAREHNAAILSCDAFAVYRGMDIGTAKPSAGERAAVPHFGIDLVPPQTPFSVGAYLEEVKRVLDRGYGTERPLLVVGGSGFYLKSFFAPVTDTLVIPDTLRREVVELEESQGLAGLLAALDQCNSEGTPDLDRNNPRRVANALLRCRASGQSLIKLQAAFAAQSTPFPEYRKRVCWIRRQRDDLDNRIATRTRAMIDAGLAEEVRRLRDAGIERNPSAANAIGYRETLAYLAGELEESAWEEAITTHTRQLARKQERWLTHQIPVEREIWLSPRQSLDPSGLFPNPA